MISRPSYMTMSQRWGLTTVIALYLGLALSYSLVVPIFEAPDELAHFEYARYLALHHQLPFEARPGYPGYIQTGGYPPLYYALGAVIVGAIDTSDYHTDWPKNPYFSYGPESLGANVFQHTPAEDFPFRQTALAVHLLRVLSILLGAGTVTATWLLARTLLPHSKWLPLGAAAFVGFLPQFIFVSGSINNDNLVNFLAALSLVQIVRIAQGQASSPRDYARLGLLIGLANLTKGSALALVPLAGLVMAWDARRTGAGAWLPDALAAAAAFVGIAGWWFVRNLLAFGDPLALKWWEVAYPESLRQGPLDWQQVLAFFREGWPTLWASFGWGNISLDGRIYQALLVVTVLALLGLVIHLARVWKTSDFPRWGFLLLALYVLGVGTLYFSYWTVFPVGGNQGRYMFTALAPLGVLFVFGLSGYSSERFQGLAPALVGTGLFLLAAVIPFATLLPSYQPFSPPPPISAQEVPSDATRSNLVLDDGVGLYAFALPARPVMHGRSFRVRFYWRALKHIKTDWFANVMLTDAKGRMLNWRCRRPGHGRSPTNLWQAGDIVPDAFQLGVPQDAAPGEAQLRLALTERLADPEESLDQSVVVVKLMIQ